MTTPIPSVQLLPASEDNIAIAANILRSGGLVAFPTETLYGLGADARIDAAVQKVFAAKARPPEKPLIVLVQDLRTGPPEYRRAGRKRDRHPGDPRQAAVVDRMERGIPRSGVPRTGA